MELCEINVTGFAPLPFCLLTPVETTLFIITKTRRLKSKQVCNFLPAKCPDNYLRTQLVLSQNLSKPWFDSDI